jgi:preprotein translocase subunit SecD
VARPTRAARPGRALLALLVLIIALYATVIGAHVGGTGDLTPKLGLDLAGGDEIVLQPVSTGRAVSQGTINEAINIIRDRVNGTGISEAQVTSQGGKNIVVSLPGTPSQATKNLVKTSAQLRFRAVIEQGTPGPTATPTATATATGTASGGATATATSSPTSGTTASAGVTPTTSSAGMAIPKALATTTPTATSTAAGTASAAASTPAPATTPTAKPTDASDPNWVTPAIQAQYDAETCSNLNKFRSNTDDPTKPFVTCATDGSSKYILGPVEVSGTDIKSAQAQLQVGPTGVQLTTWEVQLNFTGSGTSKFGKVTQRLVGLTGVRNEFAIEVDGTVLSSPTTQSAIEGGVASITGNFTADSSRQLANQLKYGALPISFKTLTENSISPTLGKDQLDKSLLAGLIGLLLVVAYAFAQYRLLGLVTVASLTIASSLTYGMVVYLGWAQGFRLTLAGVTGLIVSIGITADSFIVFFERVRDEVRDGRTLRSAVETGWARGRRTILAADSVSFLAAVVLFLLAAGNVQGFAYTLGLTTIIDVVVVFLFTHPMLALLARTKFFGGGHRWSGLDPERLGVTARKRRPASSASAPAPAMATASAGGGFASSEATGPAVAPAASRSGGDTIAARRAAAARAAAEQGEDD